LLQNRYEKLPVYNIAKYNAKDDATHIIQPFSFYNQDGKIVTDKNVDNKIYVADFFFTSCTSICPVMTAGLKPAMWFRLMKTAIWKLPTEPKT